MGSRQTRRAGFRGHQADVRRLEATGERPTYKLQRPDPVGLEWPKTARLFHSRARRSLEEPLIPASRRRFEMRSQQSRRPAHHALCSGLSYSG